MRKAVSTLFMSVLMSQPVSADALDVNSLWDFSNPARSESNFRAALREATGDDALILKTQIARTYSLRGQFEAARELLRPIELELERAGNEAVVRYWLELGRTYVSHRHEPASITTASRDSARTCFSTALRHARSGHLDALAVDALHMFVFVDPDPADQVMWGRQALALVRSSAKADVKRWEPSIRSNLGEAFFDLGRFDEALEQFDVALSLRSRASSRTTYRDNEWHIARTLKAQGRLEAALDLLRRLQVESEAENEPRHYIYGELAGIFEAKGDHERASHFRSLSRTISRK